MTTYKDAILNYSKMTLKYIQGWFNNNTAKRAQPVGTNSFVAPHSHYEYQLDFCFFSDLENQQHELGCVCIDIFSKYARVKPIMSTDKYDVSAGLIQYLHEMRHKPSMPTRNETQAFDESPVIQEYLRKEKIKHYITRNHAAFAERFIRTFKALLYKRIDSIRNKKKDSEDPQWPDYLHEVLITYNFKMNHSSTKITPPASALKESSSADVKANLERRALKNRRYPFLNVNDDVQILRKKKVNEKERQSPWSEETHKVSMKTEQFGQKFYKVRGSDRDYIRGEVLNMRFYSVLSLVCLNIKNYKIQKHPKHKHNTSGFSGSRTRSVYLYIRIHMYMYIYGIFVYIYIYIYPHNNKAPHMQSGLCGPDCVWI
jgi:hypothetical protein